MKSLLCVYALLTGVLASHATITVTAWRPLFKGIDHAAGTNSGTTTFTNNGVVLSSSRLQAANCLRIDLQDPDVQFFPTPRAPNYVSGSIETKTISISNFVKQYGVQVATVANFYSSTQGTDPQSEGLNCQVFGLSVCTGQVVSVPDFGPDSNSRFTAILFTTNKQAFFIVSNTPPGTNIDGIYTAVTGYYPVLTNGVLPGDALRTLYPDPTVHDPQPRTVFGLSQDRRYFYMMIIDGRQPGYSDGANDMEMGMWLLQFGARDGVTMDGGGSAAMYYQDCVGNPRPFGHSSYITLRNRERITGSQLGVYAPPLPTFISDVSATPGSTTATIMWTTLTNATSQVEYGTTTNFGIFSPLDSTLVTNHSITLGGLSSGVTYFYRVRSRVEDQEYTSSCGIASFTTTNFAAGVLIALANPWKYNTANLDGVNWTSLSYDDSSWPTGQAALWADSRPAGSPNAASIPNYTSGTRMPINAGTTYPYTTYYFRTAFVYSNDAASATLIFSNYIDDAVVLYLNGSEIFRVNLPAAPAAISNGMFATSFTCNDATCPIVFTLTDVSNFMVGTNVVAAEVHNYRNVAGGNPSPDLTFESALLYTLPPPVVLPPFITDVVVAAGETNAAITWNTLSNATSQVFYGLTPALGNSTPLDTNRVANHAVALSSLEPVTQYYVRIVSTVGTNQYAYDATFTTTAFLQPVVTPNNSWKYTTNNLDGVNWTARDYDDSGWLGEGPPLLHIENNPGVSPLTTPLPATDDGGPFPTYYFRTHFTVSGPVAGLAMLFTNQIDDGAVFYLNGAEIQRVRMTEGAVAYVDFSAGCPPNSCETTLDVPDVFRVGGDVMTNIVVGGDNVLAAEVHQHDTSSSDIVFGSYMSFVRAGVSETRLNISQSNNVICITWPGAGLTLQQASGIGANQWSDVPGPVKTSPYCLTNPAGTTFFRLRN